MVTCSGGRQAWSPCVRESISTCAHMREYSFTCGRTRICRCGHDRAKMGSCARENPTRHSYAREFRPYVHVRPPTPNPVRLRVIARGHVGVCTRVRGDARVNGNHCAYHCARTSLGESATLTVTSVSFTIVGVASPDEGGVGLFALLAPTGALFGCWGSTLVNSIRAARKYSTLA